MGRAPCCDKANVKRGPWSPDEDAILKNYIQSHGTGSNWITLPKKAGLKRCGKSCRLRWLNYLRPDIRHGGFTEEEDSVIFNLYNEVGSRWSVIASHLPGRTDNDIKNYWNTKLRKKILSGKINPSSTNAIETTDHHHPRVISPPDLHYGSSSVSFPQSLDNLGFRVKPEIGPICSDFGSSVSTQECSSINSSNSPNSLVIDNGFGGYSGGEVDAWFGFSWDKMIDDLLSDDVPNFTDFAFH